MTADMQPDTLVAPAVPGPSIGRLNELPAMNLMPPEIAERAALRQVKALGAGAVLLSAIAVGGLYYHAHTTVTAAQDDLSRAQQQAAAVQQQVATLAPVAAQFAAVKAAKAEVSEALSGEIQWSGKLNDLSMAVPKPVWLTSMSYTPGGSSGGSLSTPGIGELTFQGYALQRDDVATWLEALTAQPNSGYANPYVSQTAQTIVAGHVVINFSSTVDVTAASLSGRYTSNDSGS